MSRSLAVLIAAFVIAPAPALAQDVYGPQEADETEEEPPNVLADATRPCETEAQEDGVILVCRELEDQERFRSPIPREVRSDRHIIPGLTDPPCWVTNPDSVGTASCMRVGWVPERAIIVDVTAFPEPLSDEDAALVSEAEEGQEFARPAVGERVAIDLTEDN